METNYHTEYSISVNSLEQLYSFTVLLLHLDKDGVKRKINGSTNSGPEAKHVKKGVDYLSDLIVLGLPYKATEEDLKDHFSKYGELGMAEVRGNLQLGFC